MAQSFSVKAILEAVDQGFSSTIDKAGQSVQNFGNATQDKLAGVGKAMTVAGAATTIMSVQAIKNFGSFQQALNQAAVIAGGTSKDIDDLADVANRMGAELPISAQDASNAMVAMARDGASIGTIKKEFPAIAQAATAAGADLQVTASVVQQSMNIWGKSLKSPQQAAGILVQVANQSNASIESMQQALADVGPTASAAGYSMQDTANAIGLLTNTGMSAAQAADNLNHAIVLMQSPTKQSKAYMDQLGVSFRDAQGNMKSLPQIAGELNAAFDKASKSTQGFGKAQQDAALKSMFGQDGMRVMRTLMKSVADETNNTTTSWNASSKAIEKFAGTTATATNNLSSQANEMQQNLGSKIEQLGGNWEALSNKAMAAKGGVNSSLLDMMNSTLEWASSSENGIAKVTRGFIGLSPVVGPATTALGGFITNAGKILGVTGGIVSGLGNTGKVIRVFAMAGGDISKVTKALTVLSKESKIAKIALTGLKAGSSVFSFLVTAISKVGKAFSILNSIMMANPFIAIAAVIAIVVAGLIWFFTQTKTGQKLWQQFTQFLSDAWQGLVSIAQSVWSAIASAFTTVVEVIKGVWSGITGFFSGLWQGIVSIATTVWNSLVAVITTVWNVIKTVVQTGINVISTVIQSVMTVIQAIWSAVWNVISTVAQTVWSMITTAVQTGITMISSIIQATLTIIQTVWSTIWNVIVTVVQTVWNMVVTIISTAINVVAGIIQAITQAIQGNWSAVWNTIVSVAITVWNGIKSVVSAGINGVKSVITTVMNGLKSVISTVWNTIKSVFNAGVNFIKSVVHIDLGAQGRAIINSFLNGLKSAWEAVKSFVGGIGSWIKAHKGPISYDRKLLIPAGIAIMTGFNKGLQDQFETVKKGVSNMAGAVSDAVSSNLETITVPSPNTRDFMNTMNALQSANQNLYRQHSVGFGGTFSDNLTIDSPTMAQENNNLLRKLADKQQDIYLDGNVLVGGTYDRYNHAFGNGVNLQGRWN